MDGQCSPYKSRLSALDPGKQGLKLSKDDFKNQVSILSALDPGKQGLKHIPIILAPHRGTLSALDPGKQGLKQDENRSFEGGKGPFSA